MAILQTYDYVDGEINDLHERFGKTNGNLESLYDTLLKITLEHESENLETLKHNEGLLYDNPKYKSLNDQDSSISILKELLDRYYFDSLEEFNAFMNYVGNHKALTNLQNLDKVSYLCIVVLSIEGVNSSGISDYSLSYVNEINNSIPEILDDKSYKEYVGYFPKDLAKSDGETINELYLFLRRLELDNVADLKKDVKANYKIDFEVLDDELSRGTIGLVARTIKKYVSTLNRRVKK